ncbi:conserved hypothetical protein [Trichinella spiralis]|uniref:hypothetical protein n=1 Tax=Trichinella spiralis TaxID=6334 RepID=UPI0001EFE14D|nr:conserved hypothetical protein [Trichinella spiralis]
MTNVPATNLISSLQQNKILYVKNAEICRIEQARWKGARVRDGSEEKAEGETRKQFQLFHRCVIYVQFTTAAAVIDVGNSFPKATTARYLIVKNTKKELR